jgi:hypothetical protein
VGFAFPTPYEVSEPGHTPSWRLVAPHHGIDYISRRHRAYPCG